MLQFSGLRESTQLSAISTLRTLTMEKTEVGSEAAAQTPKKASPPSKKLRTADFGTLIRRSHSITESNIADMFKKTYKEKLFNDA